jgi:RNA polymerase sigma factor (sigma-70 family)
MVTALTASLSLDGTREALVVLSDLFSIGSAGEEVGSSSLAQSIRSRDALLVERAKRGDQDSFRALVETHGRAVYALALRIVQSPPDAEEVAQDTFLRAWRALPEFRGESSFSTWIYRIASRRALSRAEAVRRRLKSEMSLDACDAEGIPDPAGPRTTSLTRLRLERLIAALPELQRAAITLFYLQDRSIHEVATALDLPVGTVKTHLHRSRIALRAAWIRETGLEEDDELRRL